ncbi:MAG: DUF2169 domain-containing protein [Planctomycetes bacterium]|nr:DUF2169 domain-containing protein [Planctomycetota bacterium]
MLQLDNQTRLAGRFTIVPDESGVDSLCALVKATLEIRQSRAVLHREQTPVQLEDVYRGEPGASSIARPSDFALRKPAADVLLAGHAYAPAGKKTAAEVDVGLRVGAVEKFAHVVGDRVWRESPAGVQATAPRPFEKMPLIYERAYGGRDASADSERFGEEPRNPVGTGYLMSGGAARIDGLALANLEEPGRPIRRPRDCYPVVSFGPIGPSWEPRRRYAGTFDEAWQKSRAPYLPEDFDARFFNCAPRDQQLAEGIQGGEEVRLLNLTPAGQLHFEIPRLDVRCVAIVSGREVDVPMACDTLLIEPDHMRCSLLWRGLAALDKNVLKLDTLRILCPQAPANGGGS